jgi:hypothetical protein
VIAIIGGGAQGGCATIAGRRKGNLSKLIPRRNRANRFSVLLLPMFIHITFSEQHTVGCNGSNRLYSTTCVRGRALGAWSPRELTAW